jgi:ribosomal protein S1
MARTVQKVDNNLEKRWEKMKQDFPIGTTINGIVLRNEPFGVFLNIGYPVLKGYQFSGIIDILIKDDENSEGLPMNYDLWPKVGATINCKVRWHRDHDQEISLAIARQ